MIRILLGIVFAATAGCGDYNFHSTDSEADSLSDVTRLTTGFDKAGQARWTRDLQWAVFRAIPTGEQHHQIYLARSILTQTPDGPVVTGLQRPIRVTPPGSRNGGAAFSPDGSTLILSSTGTGQKMRLFEADGWRPFVAAVDGSRGADLTTNPIPDGLGVDPDVSPDGKRIIFVRDGSILSTRLDGSDPHTLTQGPDAGPRFSPDGRSIVYSHDNGNHAPQIYLADVVNDGTAVRNPRPLTRDPNSNVDPDWHPDGRHVVYATSLHGRSNYELYVMTTAGGKKTRVTFYDGADLFPQFAPDGRHLMWTSRRTTDGTTQVYTARFRFPHGS